jgi:hypothetical protein
MESLITFNGKKYLSVADFARLSGRTTNTIHILCTRGNGFRKLVSVKLGSNRFVEADELFAFPFVARGRYGPQHPKRINDYGELVDFTDGVL